MNLYYNINATNNNHFGVKTYSFNPFMPHTGIIANGKPALKSLKSDVFIRTISPKELHFGSSTANGRFLRVLNNITDPYSGIKMLSIDEMEHIKTELDNKNTLHEQIKYLSKYQKNMFPTERKIFNMCSIEEKIHHYTSFSEILRDKRAKSFKVLHKEQKKVFDSIEKEAQNISLANKNNVLNQVNYARECTASHNHTTGHHFKRKTFIYQLITLQQNAILDNVTRAIETLPEGHHEKAIRKVDEVREYINNKHMALNQSINKKQTPLGMVKELQRTYTPEEFGKDDDYTKIIKIANNLPSSTTSTSSFIVKYFDRTDKEIREKLFDDSFGTIEHIKADSLGGKDDAANFILASMRMNNEKENSDLPQFIKLYPKIPKYCQKYTNDMIDAVYRGDLKGYEWYPYVYKDTLHQEAGIDINLNKYKISPKEAFRTLPDNLNNIYPYSKYVGNNK